MRYLFLIGFIFSSFLAVAQDKKIDQLEVLYDQGYYPKVLRKASKLIALPEYDYSGLPSFYKSMALFRMAGDPTWFKRHDYAIDEAIAAYDVFMSNDKILDYLSAHNNEIASLKTYLVNLELDYKALRFNAEAKKLEEFRAKQLKSVKARPDFNPADVEIGKGTEVTEENSAKENGPVSDDFRQRLVVYAKSLVGVKYRWAGNDPKGFDCSGFVGYVHQKYGITIPRTASAQMAGSKKVKTQDAFLGDLLFFASSSTISHVGMVVNEKGNNLIMVHASTSKGVIITEIDKSSYWKPKLKGAGTFI